MRWTSALYSWLHALSRLPLSTTRSATKKIYACSIVLFVLAVSAGLLGAGNVRAQPTPVSEITGSGGNTLMLVYDNGEIEVTGGFLLPDETLLDAAGDLGAFSLPFSGSASSANPAFEVENTGSGDALLVSGAGADGLDIRSPGNDGLRRGPRHHLRAADVLV